MVKKMTKVERMQFLKSTQDISVESHGRCALCAFSKNSVEKEAISFDINEISTTLTIAAETFHCIRNKILALSHKNHLPKITSMCMPRDRDGYCPNIDNLLRLCFLSMIKEMSNKIPVTKEEAKIFDESYAANTKTSKWLGWRGIGCYILLASCGGALNFLGYAQIARVTNGTSSDSSSSNADNINKIFTTVMICITVIAVGILTNCAGLWWTGRHPDNSSNKANLQQNRIHLLQREYLDIALELINLYCNGSHRPLAQSMSKEIEVKAIAKILNEKAHDKDAADLVGLADLEAVIEYIKSDGELLPRNTLLRSHISLAEKYYIT